MNTLTSFRKYRILIILAAALGLMAASGTWAFAQVAEDGAIHACMNASDGTIHIVSDPASCKRNEQLLSWNIMGTQGPAGPAGPQGPQGDVGPAGAQGLPGEQGLIGPAGPAGPQGPAGLQGDPGLQGETGPAGPAGPQGLQGEVGPAGPQGPQGDPGQGINTLDGLQGIACNQGPAAGVLDISYDAEGLITLHCVPSIFALNVTVAGTNHGSVTSAPAGINCGGDCSEEYLGGTLVTLTAAGDDAYTQFQGWSGDCTGTGACVVTMDAAKNVTATFTHQTFPLNVTLAGDGLGTVTSTPAGINCGSDCSEEIDAGTLVTLFASPGSQSGGGLRNLFQGWTGDCTGTGSCEVTMDQVKNVTATFRRGIFLFPTILTPSDGSGSRGIGSLSFSQGRGTVCQSNSAYESTNCQSLQYYAGEQVTITATAGPGDVFSGWDSTPSGTCVAINGTQCQFDVTETTPNQVWIRATFLP